ncbi:hypothetical protein EOT10_26830 [Streptomyces antnestii]|uniref:Uncharacterized protein n=1 Tax=Streptomyces antnestii TaxID=2494256 RepID=A0A3S2XR35_9ACTN|nr:hypothetical protein [Streptomyces sp. San01]RVU20943.1 hypothetical protein EOT10_26830 [Streptomyces sp. San01]
MRFLSWQRSSMFAMVASPALTDGRLVGHLPLTLADDITGETATGGVDFHLMAPQDVAGLVREAVLRTVPGDLAHEVEATKLVHVDFAEPDLPWRYTPELAAGDRLAPWLALLVGTTDEVRIDGPLLRIDSPGVFDAYPPGDAYRWAHVHDDGKRPEPLSRLISPRELLPDTAYVAALVPAFDESGGFAWDPAAGQVPAGLPAFRTWRFWTGPAGDFETLAFALTPAAVPGLGRAPLAYRRGALAEDLEVPGAITGLGGAPDGPAEAAARADLIAYEAAVQALAATDPLHRQVVQPPRYGLPWTADPQATGWGGELNADPRLRGTAGLGTWMGIEGQQELLDAATAQLGGVRAAAHLIEGLACGLLAAQSLWTRRLPAEPARQVHLLAPLMRRMRTAGGTAMGAVTGPDSPLDPALFSSAARRALHRGRAAVRHSASGVVGRDELLAAANRCPPRPPRLPRGLPHADTLGQALGQGPVEAPSVLDLRPLGWGTERAVEDLTGRTIDEDFFTDLAELTAAIEAEHGRCGLHVLLLQDHMGETATRELLVAATRACLFATGWEPNADPPPVGDHPVDIGRLRGAVGGMLAAPPPDPCLPVGIDEVAAVVTQAVDPHGADAPARRRVGSRIGGLPIGDLRPPEVPLGLDFPTWTLLRDQAKQWLLPGLERLPRDSIVALRTNPRFVDAYLTGLNQQLLGELHWRNVPVDRTGTPLLMFWGHVDFAQGRRVAEIRPVAAWDAATALGDVQHQVRQPGDTTGKEDLVIVFRSDLFWRYPATQVYLVRAQATDAADDATLSTTPDFALPAGGRDARVFIGPTFQGAVSRDVVFFAFDVDPAELAQFWLVLDEPPSELRFRARDGQTGTPLGGTAASAAQYAIATIDQKTRVAISGPYLQELGLRP